MNERIGTFCEKCREVVCRCAEYKKILDECFKETYKRALDKTRISSISLDSEPYGWVIEQNMNVKYQSKDGIMKWTGWQGWVGNWKNKVYKTKEMVLHAIEQRRKSDGSINIKINYRILPVYSGEPEVLDNVMDLLLKQE